MSVRTRRASTPPSTSWWPARSAVSLQHAPMPLNAAGAPAVHVNEQLHAGLECLAQPVWRPPICRRRRPKHRRRRAGARAAAAVRVSCDPARHAPALHISPFTLCRRIPRRDAGRPARGGAGLPSAAVSGVPDRGGGRARQPQPRRAVGAARRLRARGRCVSVVALAVPCAKRQSQGSKHLPAQQKRLLEQVDVEAVHAPRHARVQDQPAVAGPAFR